MRRMAIALALGVALGAALVTYLDTRDQSPPSTLGITLTAQKSPAFLGNPGKRQWRITRLISLSCGGSPTVSGSDTASAGALCKAVRYYAHHLPKKPCVVLGFLGPRVLITGSLDGHPLRLSLGTLCNPPPALSRAAQTISIAAFDQPLHPNLSLSARVARPGQLISMKATGCAPLLGQRDEMTWHNRNQLSRRHASKFVSQFQLHRSGNVVTAQFRVPEGTPRGRGLLDMFCGYASGGNAVASVIVR